MLALHLYGQENDLVYHRWRKQVRTELRGFAAGVERLNHRYPTLPALLGAIVTDCVQEADDDRERRQELAFVERFRTVAVDPYWDDISRRLEEIREVKGRTVIANGMEHLLGALHPRLCWKAPVLQLRHRPEEDRHLDGSGVVISPSMFLPGKQCELLDLGPYTDGPVLVFPAEATTRPGFPCCDNSTIRELGELMGHTRAAALQALTTGCSTGELAHRLGISLAGASKHAAVLRRAGLIATSRQGTTALHRLTDLGAALIEGRGPVSEAHRPDRFSLIHVS